MTAPALNHLAHVITPRSRDIGSLIVRRVLPNPQQRSVGPFVFFDEMGPAVYAPNDGVQVRPHPHIGLATMTYLFAGAIRHRDSLGVVQDIRPGAVNLMTAGQGIVHSERPVEHADPMLLHGIQSWMALPEHLETCAPTFRHYAADEIPSTQLAGAQIKVVMGQAFGEQSPVMTASPTLYVDIQLPPGGRLPLVADAAEQAVFVVSGQVRVDQDALSQGQMGVLPQAATPSLHSPNGARLIWLGGQPLGPRQLEWNFVNSDPRRIQQAVRAWRNGGFPDVPGDKEWIPLLPN